jgi:hypothetical protein
MSENTDNKPLKQLGWIAVFVMIAVVLSTAAYIYFKPHTLSGQIFIVTQGRENIKLGAVEIILIEKQQVTDFLRQRQAAIDDQIRTKKMAFNDALDAIATAKSNIETATDNLQAAVARSESSAEYLRIQAQKDALSRTNAVLSDQKGLLESQLKAYGVSEPSDLYGALSPDPRVRQEQQQNLSDQGVDLRRLIPLLSQYKKVSELLSFRVGEELALGQQLGEILRHAGDEERPKVGTAQNAYNTADSRAASLREALNHIPTTDDYLSGLLGAVSVARRTLTDADGRFSFACPKRKAFMLYANAQRKVPSEYGTHTEEYYWLVDATTDNGNAQIFLSNNNLWMEP